MADLYEYLNARREPIGVVSATRGLSAYEVWLAEGNTGTEEDFLTDLRARLDPAQMQQVEDAAGRAEDAADKASDDRGAVASDLSTVRDIVGSVETRVDDAVSLAVPSAVGSASDADAAVFEDSIGQIRARLTDSGEFQVPAVAADHYGVGDDAIAQEDLPGWRMAMVDRLGFVYAGLDDEGVFHGGAGADPGPEPTPSMQPVLDWTPGPGRIVPTAHRGVHVGPYPENSLDGLYAAARAGYEWVETDVQRTSDGEYVLMHDGTIDRTCRLASDYSAPNGVTVASLTLAQLRSDYVLASSDPAMRQPVPTFAEYLDLCCALGLKPFVELKNVLTQAQAIEIADMTISRLGEGNYIHNSFSPAFLDAVHAKYPGVTRMYNVTPDVVDYAALAAKKPAVWTTSHTLQTAEAVAGAHAVGLPVNAYTVPESRLQDMLNLGLDMVTTDNIAPAPRPGSVVASISAHGDFSDLDHDGSVVGGELILDAGQSVTFGPGGAGVPLGAAYADIWFSGAVTFSGALSGSYTRSAKGPLRRSLMLSGFSPAITVTGGTGGASIRSISLAIAQF